MSSRMIATTFVLTTALIATVERDLPGKPSGEEAKAIKIDSLNSGDVVLIGKLGHPFGTYHDIVATFGVPNSKGRSGQGGRLYLYVSEIDGIAVTTPLWLPYYKSISLQDYKLPDGTDIFAQHPNTHILSGKKIQCKVYESFHMLDISGDVSEHFGNTTKKGFEQLYYEPALAILHVHGAKKEAIPTPGN